MAPLGNAARGLGAVGAPRHLPIVWELKQLEPSPQEPGAWRPWGGAGPCALQAFPGGPYRSRAGRCWHRPRCVGNVAKRCHARATGVGRGQGWGERRICGWG